MTIADIQEIEGLIEEWASSYIRTAELPNIILDKARSANLEINELRQLVEKALSARGLSDRQIRRMLPQELKRDYTKVTNTEYSDIMSESVPQDEYIPPRVEQPTQIEQEYIKQVEQDQPKPTVTEIPTPQTGCTISGVIQCRLGVNTDHGLFSVMVTVRISAGHKVKLDPIHRSDIRRAE